MVIFSLGTAIPAAAYGKLQHPKNSRPYLPANIQGYPAQTESELERRTEVIHEPWPLADENRAIYLAAPENLNPGLYRPPVEPDVPDIEQPNPAPNIPPETLTEEKPSVPFWQLENLSVDFSDAFTNFSQGNRFIEPTVSGFLANGDRLAVTSGLNTFTQPDTRSVINVPLKVAWTREIGDFTTTLGGGIDLFDRLPTALNFAANTSVPLGQQAVLSFFVEQGPYKFNATTLNNQITSLRYGPNLYWQINQNTSFFSLVRWGHYNDGNREQQSFSRLEHRAGDFSLAANVFNWRYHQDAEVSSGYFSPPDFLVLNGEIAWEGEVLNWLDCRLTASWGQQRLTGDWTSAFGYSTQCTVEVTESLEFDLKYAFDNVISQTGGSAFNNRAISGQVRARF
ncbi:MAG: hypothetical protein F6K04_19495 [Leptolyngbya sp. SIO4C5]|nr:hypothetical protein [Leptolyngbya sp. SIO4C5]